MSRRSQQGYILFTVVAMLVVVAVIAFLVSYDSSLKASIPEREAEASRADYVAAAAMQHALWYTQNNACMGDVTIPTTALGADSYAATITGAAAGTFYTLNADQDAWIRSDDVTRNNGTTVSNHVKFQFGNIEQILTRFDLSSLPADAQINSATAWFYVRTLKPHPDGPITIHEVTSDWAETTVTWDSFGGGYSSASIGMIPAQDSGDVWVAINLTGQVQAWVNGQPNYGILFNSTAEGVHPEYMAREDGANPPRLEVVVGSGSASPVTIRATGELESGVKRKLKDKIVTAYQPPGTVTLQLGTDPGADAMLDSFYPRNYGAQDFVQVNEDTGNWIQRPVLKFGLGRIPARAAILSAQLELRLRSIKTPGTITVHRVARSWIEGTKYGTGTADGATWATHDGTNNWKTAGGDFNAATVAETAVAATDTWVTWEIGPLVEQWLAGEPNNGLLIKSDGILEEAEFYSKEETDATLRPKLTITYACECGSTCMAPQGSGNVLMVVDSTSSPWGEDIYKRDLLESWGYTVTMLADGHGQSTFDSAIAANDVILVSETIASADLGTKLGNPAIGIVNTDGWMNDEFGFESGNSSNWPVGKSINITDTSHYITAPFVGGALDIYDVDMGGLAIDNTAAPDLQPLADWPTGAGLATLDTGAMTAGGTTTAGRRVMLPFGRDPDLYWPKVNNNGHLILKRAIAWAASPEDGDANSFILSTDGDATLGGLDFLDTDLARYRPFVDSALLFLDSVSAGMTKKIDALHVLENGHLILSVDAGTTFAGLSVGSEDLFEYDPVAGTATMYLEADVHFESKKDIISVHVLDNGNTVLSVSGNAILGGLAFSDRDLVEYNRFTGQASIYFDGDATTLSQRISALHILANGHIVMAPEGDTTLGGLSFGPDQLVDYDPVADLAVLYFDGEALFSATSEKVTAVHIGAGSGTIVPTIGTQHLLFVVGSVGGAGPTTEELAHRTLIESWDYSVELIDDDASQAEFDIAVANNDVVFTTNDITASNLNTKLVGATIGVVTSEDNLSDEFGLSSSIGWGSANYIGVVDNSHYITLPFETSKFPISAAAESLAYLTGTLSPDLGLLAEAGGGNALVTLESGATTYSGGIAAGRRAQLPWGGNGFDPNNLNADGLTILRRALEWGAGAVVAPDVHLSTDSDAILGGLSFQDTDVARYQSTTDMADLYLDSLAAGLDKKVDALHILENGHLILSTQADATFGGLTFKSEDLIEYDPVAGTATMYLEANVHFDSMKDIISVHILDNGNAVLSTNGNAILGGLAFSDRDLVEYDRSTGTASIFFDGDATMLSQRISAVHVLPNGNIILAPEGDTTLGGLSFGPDQLVEYNPILDLAALYFDGESLFSETSEKVRSVHVGPGSGAGVAASPDYNVLLIVGNDTTLASKDVGYKALMESWGHTVAVIDDGASQANYDTAMAAADVIYASGSALGANMLDKATYTTKGLVNEVNGKIDNFGFSSSTGATANLDTFSTTNAAHYITEPFAGSAVTVFTSSLTNPIPSGTLAPDLKNVGEVSGTPSLVTLDAGATGWNGNPVPARRAHLPFASAETTDMTSDGKTILQRAIEWAAGSGSGGGGGGGGGGCSGGGTMRDEFNATNFSGSDGTLTWAGDWIEVGESDGATSGDIRVIADQSNYQLRTRDNNNGGEGVEREVDLSGATSASLSYDYRRMSLDSTSDYTSVQISANGAAGPWEELTRHDGSGNDSSYQPASHNITAYKSANTRVRFITSSSMGGTDTVWFDNIEIACTP